MVACALLASIAAAKNWQWKPVPVARAPDPSETVRTAPASAWRSVDAANLLVIELKEGGRAIVELAPEFAPVHVANIRALARAGWWNGAGIYRVQDNYVAQWGNNDGKAGLPGGVTPRPPAEYDRPMAGMRFRRHADPASDTAASHMADDGEPEGFPAQTTSRGQA